MWYLGQTKVSCVLRCFQIWVVPIVWDVPINCTCFLCRSGIAESPLNWLDSYFAWLSFDGGCCGYYNTSTPSNPEMCDKPSKKGEGGG